MRIARAGRWMRALSFLPAIAKIPANRTIVLFDIDLLLPGLFGLPGGGLGRIGVDALRFDGGHDDALGELVGRSPAMQHVITQVRQVAPP